MADFYMGWLVINIDFKDEFITYQRAETKEKLREVNCDHKQMKYIIQ